MANYKIYHNPRCAKSRECLALLTSLIKDFEVVDYLKNPLSKEEIKELLSKLNIQPIELVRTKETIWKDHFKGKSLMDNEIIDALVLHPKLIERPIIVKSNKAIIGRPTDKILTFL
jgi:arsenate reductase